MFPEKVVLKLNHCKDAGKQEKIKATENWDCMKLPVGVKTYINEGLCLC